MPWKATKSQELTREECFDHLRSKQLGVLSLTVRALPAVFPVAYALRHDQTILRCAPNGVLGQKIADQIVSLVAFEISDGFDRGWMVTTTGRAEVLADPTERRACDSLPLPHWSDNDLFVRIATELISGHRLVDAGETVT